MKTLNEIFRMHDDDEQLSNTDGYHLVRRGHYEVEVRLDGTPVKLFINPKSYHSAWIDACEWLRDKEG